MSVREVEEAALALPESELMDLVKRLFVRINPASTASRERVQLADEREAASKSNPAGDSDFNDFVAELRKSL